jgi:hypothetical protein
MVNSVRLIQVFRILVYVTEIIRMKTGTNLNDQNLLVRFFRLTETPKYVYTICLCVISSIIAISYFLDRRSINYITHVVEIL